jgi:putative selenate reductase
MSDTMRGQPFDRLISWVLTELATNDSIFGIHRALFFTPKEDASYTTPDLFGNYLATPIGPAAGPHTQLAQNIVSAWLSGGRFIELKTVQIMDELEIPRPCIDLADEGYNVEWSQELKLEQSADEYIKAWVLIHILRRILGFEGLPFGTIFNMSVGYDLAGIKSEPMQRFMDTLEDASKELEEVREILRARFPEFSDIEIPNRLINSVTLSTMHGCPPDEIEQIARYLVEERGLHTIVKLNPTLLGKDAVMRILHDDLGFREIEIEDHVFEKDLQYDRAVELIKALKESAGARGLTFGVKLSNTLAMSNHRKVLPGEEMYMSGRALYPLTMNLFRKLSREFDGDLYVSYAGGADALNVVDILSCGALPVTSASDLLKPGGYSRLRQYIENLEKEMTARGAKNLPELARDKLENLDRVTQAAREDRRYKKSYHPYGLPKITADLNLFDCIAAPCIEGCAVNQDVPEYAWWIGKGEYDKALSVILSRNPLPGVTGYICTHLCQESCTQSNYEAPIEIRALKRFAVEHGKVALPHPERLGRKVAVIGSGPSGLAAAYFLALNGIAVTVYEAKAHPGGMLNLAPLFRLPREVISADIDRILDLGVDLKLEHPVTAPPEELLEEGYDAVYIATGFPRDATLKIDGIEGDGAYTALDFLERVSWGEKPSLGERVVVIGGGNTAMDAARTAARLSGNPVTVLYRRTRAEMPAAPEEIEDLLAEGNRLEELVSPKRVIRKDGRIVALECVRNELGAPDESGRRRPIPIAGSEFEIPADSVVLAIGQRPEISFLDGSAVSVKRSGAIEVDPRTCAAAPGIYAGGDIARGPAIIIQACADGRRAAEAVCEEFGIEFRAIPFNRPTLSPTELLEIKRSRARRELPHRPPTIPINERRGFDLVEKTFPEAEAQAEAGRCLQCSQVCDKCVEVCPNRANYTYLAEPVEVEIPVLVCADGRLVESGKERFTLTQPRQIIHVDDLCNECGNCATFCVHQGKPYLEKPRLFLKREDFSREEDNVFYIEGSTIYRREEGKESSLTFGDSKMTFKDEFIRLTFAPDFSILGMELKREFQGERSIKGAIEMAVILNGVRRSLPFLLEGE